MEPFGVLDRLDLAVDRPDQVAPDLWLVKGGGGVAHTRGKVVAAAAQRFVVHRLPEQARRRTETYRPPLEILEFGLGVTLRQLA